MQSSLFVQYLLRLTAVFVIKNRKRPECTLRFLPSEEPLIIILLSGCISVLEMKIVRRVSQKFSAEYV